MLSLEGRIALVTGAARPRGGSGRGIALELARAGADVAVHARAWEDDPWPMGEIAALGRRALTVEGDLADGGHARRLAARSPRGSARWTCSSTTPASRAAREGPGRGLRPRQPVSDGRLNLNAGLRDVPRVPARHGRGGWADRQDRLIAGRTGQLRMGADAPPSGPDWLHPVAPRSKYAPTVRATICPGMVDTEEMYKTFARRDELAGPRPAPPRRSASRCSRSSARAAPRTSATPRSSLLRRRRLGGRQTLNVDGGQAMN